MRSVFLASLCCLLIVGCSKEKNNEGQPLPFFSDPVVQSIYNFQDQRDTDSLKVFLKDPNPVYRKLAATAFASVQDSGAIPALFSLLLNDNDSLVRKTAAFSLGQTYDSTAAERLLESLGHEESAEVRETILASIGKCIPAYKLQEFNTFQPENIPEKKGLMRGFYYAGVRNVYDPYSIDRAVGFLNSEEPYEVRLAAAHFLARIRDLHADDHFNEIANVAKTEKAADVRMSLALVLGKIRLPETETVLKELSNDSDFRVRINVASALSNFENEQSLEILSDFVFDDHQQVAIKASEVLKQKDFPGFVDWASQTDLNDLNWRVKRNIQEKWLSVAQSDTLANQLKQEFQETTHVYDKAAILTALGQYLPAYEFVVTHTFSSENKAVSTAGISAITNYVLQENFPGELWEEFIEIIKKATLTGDLALVWQTSRLLQNPTADFKTRLDSFDFLYQARAKLTLPKDNEAIQALDRVIAFFEDKEYEEVKNEYNHPLDWEHLETLNEIDTAVISTTEGDITIKLFTKEAPGSVSNFLKLAEAGYYNGIAFHRIVPNFVIQGGCNRGDGFGGLDYSIRSEFSQRKYTTGSMGMASAGKDTEGTQFFITHSTTMHLDGKYTIFAEVIEGMGVVNAIEMGSEIIEVRHSPTSK